jgi:thiol-disulfide isomerase/thioredoxin
MKKGTLIIMVLLGLGLGCQGKKRPAEPQAGLAADFTLLDLADNQHTLSRYQGQVVLLDFWATWCGPCRAAIPELIKLDEEYRVKGLVVLGIGLDSKSALQVFAQNNHITYPILVGNQALAQRYEVTAIPTTYLIDKSGRVARRWVGFTPGLETQFRAEIERLLTE